ncbi:MAG: 3-ketosteroid-9-alpha-hydroxylase subunit A [Tetrasphaera sp.]|nr:3-ketosteroid-9-alpha-hydroxylase subunit A [Tetrasphaera sp.]
MSPQTEVRRIEADAAPDRYARGWHCLGLAKDFSDGKPHQVMAFGQKLVVFANSSGEIGVIDAYCRHMGGDLSQGTVKGDEIACPFHDWRWGADGRCKAIPYAKRVPLRARTATWPTLVQDGMLFVWNDPEGNAPDPAVAIPVIEGASSDEWTDWLWKSIEIDGANCREIVDNNVDMAHFYYVHYSFPTYFKNVFEGHVASQWMNGTPREDVMPKREGRQLLGQTSVASYYGPSFMIDDLVYHYSTGDVHSILINCHYPVSPTKFVLQYGIIVKKSDIQGNDPDKVAKVLGDFIALGFEQDVAIWQNKARIDNPLLCEEDGPVYQLRRWYEQFYVDVADITPDMTDRFEHEIDTTRPNEAWRAECEANIRRRDELAALKS